MSVTPPPVAAGTGLGLTDEEIEEQKKAAAPRKRPIAPSPPPLIRDSGSRALVRSTAPVVPQKSRFGKFNPFIRGSRVPPTSTAPVVPQRSRFGKFNPFIRGSRAPPTSSQDIIVPKPTRTRKGRGILPKSITGMFTRKKRGPLSSLPPAPLPEAPDILMKTRDDLLIQIKELEEKKRSAKTQPEIDKLKRQIEKCNKRLLEKSIISKVGKEIKKYYKEVVNFVYSGDEIVVAGERVYLDLSGTISAKGQKFVLFSEKYFPSETDNSAYNNAIVIFRDVFTGYNNRDDKPLPICDTIGREILIKGLNNRLSTLREEIIEMKLDIQRIADDSDTSNIQLEEAVQHFYRIRDLINTYEENPDDCRRFDNISKNFTGLHLDDDDINQMLKTFAFMILQYKNPNADFEIFTKPAISVIETLKQNPITDNFLQDYKGDEDIPHIVLEMISIADGNVSRALKRANDDTIKGIISIIQETTRSQKIDTAAINNLIDTDPQEYIKHVILLLIDKFKKATATAVGLNAQAESLSNTKETLEGDLAEAKAAAVAAGQAKDAAAAAAAAQAQIRIAEAEAALEREQANTARQQVECDKVKAELQLYTEAFTKISDMLPGEKTDDKEIIIERIQTIITEKEEFKEELKEKRLELEKQISELSAQIAVLTATGIESVESQKNALAALAGDKAALDTQIASLTKEAETNKGEIATLREEIATLREDDNTNKARIAALTAERDDCREALNAKTAELAAAKAASDEASASLSKLQADLSGMEVRIAASAANDEELKGLKLQYTTLTGEHGTLQEGADAAAAKVLELEAAAEGQRMALEALQNELKECKELNTSKDVTIAEQASKIAELDEKLAGFQAELDKKIQENTAALEALTNIQADLEAAKATNLQLQSSNSTFETDKTALDTTIADNNAQIAALNAQIVELNEEIKGCAALKEELGVLKEKSGVDTSNILELEAKISNLTGGIIDIKGKVENGETILTKEDKSNNDILNLIDAFNTALAKKNTGTNTKEVIPIKSLCMLSHFVFYFMQAIFYAKNADESILERYKTLVDNIITNVKDSLSAELQNEYGAYIAILNTILPLLLASDIYITNYKNEGKVVSLEESTDKAIARNKLLSIIIDKKGDIKNTESPIFNKFENIIFYAVDYESIIVGDTSNEKNVVFIVGDPPDPIKNVTRLNLHDKSINNINITDYRIPESNISYEKLFCICIVAAQKYLELESTEDALLQCSLPFKFLGKPLHSINSPSSDKVFTNERAATLHSFNSPSSDKVLNNERAPIHKAVTLPYLNALKRAAQPTRAQGPLSRKVRSSSVSSEGGGLRTRTQRKKPHNIDGKRRRSYRK